MEYRLTEPFTKDKLKDYRAGDRVLITGTVYTARDAAHKRITEMLMRGENPPFDSDRISLVNRPHRRRHGHSAGARFPHQRIFPFTSTIKIS